LKENGKPLWVLKPLDTVELRFYELVSQSPADPIRSFIPRFEGVSGPGSGRKDVSGTKYIRIQNLLQDYMRPKVMDVKLGCRTFGEAECSNADPRPDLYKRMCEMYPSEVTAEEHASGSTSKFRWMTVRDSMSTIRRCCYRIDGVGGFTNRASVEQDIVKYRTQDDTVMCFKHFVEVASTDEWALEASEAGYHLAESILGQLRQLREAQQQSSLVRIHEFIGTSLLFIADAAGNAGVAWIDFAKSVPVPQGVEITHRTAWEVGNHEDGLLSGMDTLISAWEEVIAHFACDVAVHPEQTHGVADDWRVKTKASSRSIDSPMSSPMSHPIPSMPLHLSRKLQRVTFSRRNERSNTKTWTPTLEDDVAVLKSLPSMFNLSADPQESNTCYESSEATTPVETSWSWSRGWCSNGRPLDRKKEWFSCGLLRRLRQQLWWSRRKSATIKVVGPSPAKSKAGQATYVDASDD